MKVFWVLVSMCWCGVKSDQNLKKDGALLDMFLKLDEELQREICKKIGSNFTTTQSTVMDEAMEKQREICDKLRRKHDDVSSTRTETSNVTEPSEQWSENQGVTKSSSGSCDGFACKERERDESTTENGLNITQMYGDSTVGDALNDQEHIGADSTTSGIEQSMIPEYTSVGSQMNNEINTNSTVGFDVTPDVETQPQQPIEGNSTINNIEQGDTSTLATSQTNKKPSWSCATTIVDRYVPQSYSDSEPLDESTAVSQTYSESEPLDENTTVSQTYSESEPWDKNTTVSQTSSESEPLDENTTLSPTYSESEPLDENTTDGSSDNESGSSSTVEPDIKDELTDNKPLWSCATTIIDKSRLQTSPENEPLDTTTVPGSSRDELGNSSATEPDLKEELMNKKASWSYATTLEDGSSSSTHPESESLNGNATQENSENKLGSFPTTESDLQGEPISWTATVPDFPTLDINEPKITGTPSPYRDESSNSTFGLLNTSTLDTDITEITGVSEDWEDESELPTTTNSFDDMDSDNTENSVTNITTIKSDDTTKTCKIKTIKPTSTTGRKCSTPTSTELPSTVEDMNTNSPSPVYQRHFNFTPIKISQYLTKSTAELITRRRCHKLKSSQFPSTLDTSSKSTTTSSRKCYTPKSNKFSSVDTNIISTTSSCRRCYSPKSNEFSSTKEDIKNINPQLISSQGPSTKITQFPNTVNDLSTTQPTTQGFSISTSQSNDFSASTEDLETLNSQPISHPSYSTTKITGYPSMLDDYHISTRLTRRRCSTSKLNNFPSPTADTQSPTQDTESTNSQQTTFSSSMQDDLQDNTQTNNSPNPTEEFETTFPQSTTYQSYSTTKTHGSFSGLNSNSKATSCRTTAEFGDYDSSSTTDDLDSDSQQTSSCTNVESSDYDSSSTIDDLNSNSKSTSCRTTPESNDFLSTTEQAEDSNEILSTPKDFSNGDFHSTGCDEFLNTMYDEHTDESYSTSDFQSSSTPCLECSTDDSVLEEYKKRIPSCACAKCAKTSTTSSVLEDSVTTEILEEYRKRIRPCAHRSSKKTSSTPSVPSDVANDAISTEILEEYKKRIPPCGYRGHDKTSTSDALDDITTDRDSTTFQEDYKRPAPSCACKDKDESTTLSSIPDDDTTTETTSTSFLEEYGDSTTSRSQFSQCTQSDDKNCDIQLNSTSILDQYKKRIPSCGHHSRPKTIQKLTVDVRIPRRSRRRTRVRSPIGNLCSFAGFFNTDADQQTRLFFWFFRSEKSWKKAPVIVWLQGEPGWSSLYSLFEEHGPYYIDQTLEGLQIRLRQFSWTKEYNVLYLDHCVGCGFSSAGNDEAYIPTYKNVAKNVHEALSQYFMIFNEVACNDVYLAGSYGAAKYIPVIAQTIHFENPSKTKPINLKGMLIGGPYVDAISMVSYGDYLYRNGLIDSKVQRRLEKNQQLAEALIHASKYQQAVKVLRRRVYCEIARVGYEKLYDIRYPKPTHGKYMFETYVPGIVETEAFKKMIPLSGETFRNCSQVLIKELMCPVDHLIPKLLKNYKILYYNGQFDIMSPYTTTSEYLLKMNWELADDYYRSPTTNWYATDQSYLDGYYKNYDNLTHVMVRNAGHTVGTTNSQSLFQLLKWFVEGKFQNSGEPCSLRS